MRFIKGLIFIACAKLKKKLKDKRGKTIKKIYEQPKTPYQRLMESKTIFRDM